MSRRTHFRALGALVAAVAVVAAQAAVSSAAPPSNPAAGQRVAQTHTDAQGRVWYAFEPDALPGFVVRSEKGHRATGGGCTFTGEGSGSAGSAPQFTRIRELTFDPRGCIRQVAEASYPLDSVPASVENPPSGTDAAGQSDTASERNALVDGAAVASAVNYYGYIKANVEDPIQLNVSSTKSTISWTATSSCVTSSTRSSYWYWYSPTGWHRVAYSVPASGSSCAKAYRDTYGKYSNDSFCPGDGNTTWTKHSKTRFEGKPAGGWYYSYSMDKWGGCSSLLHYDTDIVHP